MKYKAVFFDFDYTLGDATEAIVAGYNHAFAAMGCPLASRQAIRETVGYMLADGYTIITGDHDEGKREQFCTLFAEVARPLQRLGTPLCDGAESLLCALHDNGARLAVVSSKHTAMLVEIMEQHHLTDMLDTVLGGDVVTHGKPDPEGILIALERTGVEKCQVLFCGDTVIDAAAAQNAGVDFCAVLNGTTPVSAFAEFPHVHIAPNLPELQSWLGL